MNNFTGKAGCYWIHHFAPESAEWHVIGDSSLCFLIHRILQIQYLAITSCFDLKKMLQSERFDTNKEATEAYFVDKDGIQMNFAKQIKPF